MLGRWVMGARPKQTLLVIIDEDSPASPLVVPRLLRIADAAKYLSATTWQIETLLREKTIPSLVIGKRLRSTAWNWIATSRPAMPKQRRHSKPPSGKNLPFFGPSVLNLAWMREVTSVFCYIRTYGMICSVIAGHRLMLCPVITG